MRGDTRRMSLPSRIGFVYVGPTEKPEPGNMLPNDGEPMGFARQEPVWQAVNGFVDYVLRLRRSPRRQVRFFFRSSRLIRSVRDCACT
jgi:hypothetical protein